MMRKSVADSLASLPGKVEATYLNGLPLPDLLARAPHFSEGSLLVLTTNMADRSGRATKISIRRVKSLTLATHLWSKARICRWGTDPLAVT